MWEAIRQHVNANCYDLAHLFGGIRFTNLPEPLRRFRLSSHPTKLQPLPAAGGGKLNPNAQGGFQTRPYIQHWFDRLNWRVTRSFESWMFAPYAACSSFPSATATRLRALNPGCARRHP